MVDQPVGPGNVAMQAPTGHLEIEVGQYLVQQQPATRTSPAGAAAAGRACLTAVLPAGAITLLGAYLCEVLGGHPNLSALSGLLVTASFVYALDRFVLHPEDPADVRQSRPLFGWMLAIAALAQAALAAAVPKLAWGIVWGDLFGSAYALRFPVWRCRLKAVPFLKTAYTPFVIVSTTLLLLRAYPHSAAEWAIVVGAMVLCSLDTVLCDMKDIPSDRQAGIKTVANVLGAHAAIRLVQLIAALTAIGLLTLASLDRRTVPLAASFCCLACFAALPSTKSSWPYLLGVECIACSPLFFQHTLAYIKVAHG
jgi:4-hydroxybenzoate polyprenyltransferase